MNDRLSELASSQKELADIIFLSFPVRTSLILVVLVRSLWANSLAAITCALLTLAGLFFFLKVDLEISIERWTSIPLKRRFLASGLLGVALVISLLGFWWGRIFLLSAGIGSAASALGISFGFGFLFSLLYKTNRIE